MKYTIVPTKPGDGNFNLFENFPKNIYPADSLHFKLPDPINTEYLESCYVLTEDGQCRARIALYNNPYLMYNGKKSFCIGNYESVNDAAVSETLLAYVAQEAKQLGAAYLIGPMNGSTWDNYRFSLHHNAPNFFLEPYQHLYYNRQFVDSGFEVIAKYFSSLEREMKADIPELIQREKQLVASGMKIRNINLADFKNELKKMFEFNELAFHTNFLYTPVSLGTFQKKYTEARKFINPEFVIIAEDEKSNIIGFFFCVEDFFNRTEKSLIVKSIARHPDKKWGGLGHIMANVILKRAMNAGYKSLVHAFMREEGTSVQLSRNTFGEVYKNYALYGKAL
ncbi:MAG: hypothetical protein HY064_05565 [Bacteroidetes bacterium]|nr:hypothetical protein [Bacteroidota bacterium]